MSSNRRDFLKKVSAGTAGLAVAGSAMGMSAKSYGRIIGANEKLNVAIIGLGRRLGAYYEPISMKERANSEKAGLKKQPTFSQQRYISTVHRLNIIFIMASVSQRPESRKKRFSPSTGPLRSPPISLTSLQKQAIFTFCSAVLFAQRASSKKH